MGTPPSPDEGNRRLRLELDIDLRLGDCVWSSCTTSWPPEVWPLLRYAYAQGYSDAITEAERGQLFRDHGYEVPKRVRR